MSLRLLRRPSLAGDERGATIVEFGFLTPVLALFVMGIIDLSRGLSERFTLQQAVNSSLELVQAQPIVADDNGDLDFDFVKAEAMSAAGVPEGQVEVIDWLECDGVEKDEGEACEDGEDSARYLRVRITDNFEGQFFLGTTPMVASGALRIQ